MTNEEMQRAMEFILGQQAQASAKIDAMAEPQAESQKEAEKRWKRTDESWARTEEGIRALLATAEMHERGIQTNTQQILSVTQQIQSLGETTRATDERLNVLINVVERHISEGRNGKP